MAKLDLLPAEILCEIFKYIPRKHGCVLRLVCKTFEAAANRFVFAEVHLSFHPRSFRSMNELSMSSKLNQFVKTVLYDGAVLDPRISYEEWESCLRIPDSCHLPPRPTKPVACFSTTRKSAQDYRSALAQWKERCTPKSFYTPQQLESGWQGYQKLCRDVHDLKESVMDSTFLGSSFARFPNLSNVALETDDPLFCAYRPAMIIQCDNFESLVFKLALVRRHRRPRLLCNSDRDKYCIRQGKSIIAAIQASAAKLKRLYIRPFYWSFFHGLSGQEFKDTFLHLKCIHLGITDNDEFVVGGTRSDSTAFSQQFCDVRQRCLGAALACAEQLEDLTLDFQRTDRMRAKPSQIRVDLSEIFGTITWKQLKRLDLSHIDIARPLEFHEILSRHSETLRFLELRGFCVFDSSWPEFFAKIKKLPLLSFSLKGKNLHSWNAALAGFTYLDLDAPWNFFYPKPFDTTPFGERLVRWVLGEGDSPFEELVPQESTSRPVKQCAYLLCQGSAHHHQAFNFTLDGQYRPFMNFYKCATCGSRWDERMEGTE